MVSSTESHMACIALAFDPMLLPPLLFFLAAMARLRESTIIAEMYSNTGGASPGASIFEC